MPEETDLKLRFVGSLVEQLGAQMYPSATATIAELISNAWDADAQNVWVEIPFGKSWAENMEIVVLDDGIGMSHRDARDKYLQAGRKRRVEEKTDLTVGGRRVHGRKGIGKLAAFGTARILECVTTNEGDTTAFRLDYDEIRKLQAGADYTVEPAEDTSPIVRPDGTAVESGTRIRLTKLKLKRAINADQFRESMSRRFAFAQAEMSIRINGEVLERFSYPVQFRFPDDGKPSDDVTIADDGWAEETIAEGLPVRWWIGFTEKPIKDQTLMGISVLSRGKMVQRPFLFQRAQGVEGQLGQEYLVGEVVAEWLDEGEDIETDRIQANRDQLQLEDRELEPFVEWGRGLVRWALRKRNELRQKAAEDAFKASEELEELLKPFTPDERRALMNVARATSTLDEMDADDVFTVVRTVVDARDDVIVRQMWQEIGKEEPDVQSRIWQVVHRFGLIDARRNQTIIEARLNTIDLLKFYIKGGASEVPTIHDHIKEHTWLLDPRWHLLGDEVDVSTWGIDFTPEVDEETGNQLDFLFALSPPSPSELDEVLIVEIKRGTHPNGTTRRASLPEVNKFHGYVLAAQAFYEKSTDSPRITGMMVAEGYTQQADQTRKSFETIPDPRLRFRTWQRVIDDTERLHTGWLALAKRRGDEPEGSPTPDEHVGKD